MLSHGRAVLEDKGPYHTAPDGLAIVVRASSRLLVFMKLAHLWADHDLPGLLDRKAPDQMPAAERTIHMTRLDLQEFLRPRAAVPVKRGQNCCAPWKGVGSSVGAIPTRQLGRSSR
jgi:hypothetical protein